VLVGLVLTGDGFPVAHHVFPGNTADIHAFRSAFQYLRQRFPIRRVVMVADRGVVSEELMQELEKDEVGYILGMRMRKAREVQEEVLSRAGRHHEVAEDLRSIWTW
jgi:transposase